MSPYTAIDAHRDGRHVWTYWFAPLCYLCRREVPAAASGAAVELDGPGAIVSHAEVLAEYVVGLRGATAIAAALGVSASTVRRALRRLAAAGLID